MLARQSIRLISRHTVRNINVIAPTLNVSYSKIWLCNQFVGNNNTITSLYHTTSTTTQSNNNDEKEHKDRQGLIDHVFQFSTASHTVSLTVEIQPHNKSSIDLDTVKDNKLVIKAPKNVSESDIAKKLADIFNVNRSDVKLHGDNNNKQVAVIVPKHYDKDTVADLIAKAFVSYPSFL